MNVSPYDNLPVKGQEPKPLEYVEVPVKPPAQEAEAPAQTVPQSAARSSEDSTDTSPMNEANTTSIQSPVPDSTGEAADVQPQSESVPKEDTPEMPLQNESENKPQEVYTDIYEETVVPSSGQKTDEPLPRAVRIPASRDIPHPACTTPLDKPPQYDKLSLKNRYGSGEFILPFEETLLVPDTMPDIDSILFAEGRVNILPACKVSYEKGDTLSGDITLYTVYKPDSRPNIDVIKSTVPFRTDKCWSQSSCGSFKADVTLKSVDCQLINERKFTAKGQLAICFTEIMEQELKVFKAAEDQQLVSLKKEASVTNLNFEAEESTEISQEINLKEGQPIPRRILMADIRVVENHKQITSGKLVLNGTVHSSILYEGDVDGETQTCCIGNKTDFTQFIPVAEGLDINLIKAQLCYDDLKISISDNEKFTLEGHIKTFVWGCRNSKLQMVCDMYHKVHDISFTMEEQLLSVIDDTISGEISARETVGLEEFGSQPITLLCGSCHILQLKGRPEGGRISIEGLLHAKALARRESGEPFVINCKIPLRGTLESQKGLRTTDDNAVIDIKGYVRDFWFDEINGHQIEFNAAVAISIWIVSSVTFKTPENLCLIQRDETSPRTPMALYVVSEGDTLWSIAKKYKSDSAAIASLNDLQEDAPLLRGMKLLVMGH